MQLNRILLFVMLLLYFVGPVLTEWLLSDASRWYRPFILWLGLIAVVHIGFYRKPNNDN